MGKGKLVVVVIVLLVGATMVPAERAPVATGGGVPAIVCEDVPDIREVSEMFQGLQGFFTENLGQAGNPDVRFYAEGDGLSVGLTRDGLVIVLRTGGGDDVGPAEAPSAFTGSTYVLKLLFEGHTPVEPVGVGALTHPTSSFVGKDPAKWVRGARSFEEVVYEGLFDGIGVRFHFKDGLFKYDFVLPAWADPGGVRMRYEGASGLQVDPMTGDLLVSTPVGVLRDGRPVVLWGEGAGLRQAPGSFVLHGGLTWGFELPGCCPEGVPVTIDPGLVWSTYLGGSASDSMFAAAVDADGNVYVIGRSESNNYPTTAGANDTVQDRCKGVVTKLDPTGTKILYSTFFGGTNSTTFSNDPMLTRSVAITPDGNLALAAMTVCDDCPVSEDAIYRTFFNTSGGIDGYFLVLDPTGTSLVYATYFGGSDWDYVEHMVVDKEGAIYITGMTYSTDLDTTPNAFCSTYNLGGDTFLMKLDRTYHQVQVLTYLGGISDEHPFCMAVDAEHNMYITGVTSSPRFPTTPGAFCETSVAGGRDGYLVKFDPSGSRLVFSTLYGGRGTDAGDRLHVGSDGRVIVLAEVESTDYPVTPDAQYPTLRGSRDSAVTIFDKTGSRLVYSSYFGGTLFESVWGSALDESRAHVYYHSKTSSSQIPTTKGCYNPRFSGGGGDQMIVGFNLTSLRFDYCTYIGGSRDDSDQSQQSWGETMTSDAQGFIYLTGSTQSIDFPTTQRAPYGRYRGGAQDGFILKLDPTPIQELPAAPTGLGQKAGNNFVELKWDKSPVDSYKVWKYKVYRSTKPVIGADAITWSVFTGTMYNDTAAQNGKLFYYWISAFNSVGESMLAGPILGRPMGPPSEPQNLKATTGNGRILLRWQPPEDMRGGDLLGYYVLRGTSFLGPWTTWTVGPVCEWEDADVELGANYFYCLKAFNVIYTGELSAIVGLRALDVPSAPLRTSLQPQDRGATITWQRPISDGGTRLLGYIVLRGTSLGAMEIAGTTPPSEMIFWDSGLINGIEYIYQVAAFTEVGMGRLTAPLTIRPVGTPSEPLNVVAERGDGIVYITWSPPSNDGGWPVISYKVYAGRDVASLVDVGSVRDATAFQHTGLKNGELMYYAVLAANMLGQGPKSAIVAAIPLGPSEAPQVFIVEGQKGMVKLSWIGPSDTGGSPVLNYNLYRGEGDSPIGLLKELPPILTQYHDLDITNGREYKYMLVAVTEMGEGNPTMVESAMPYGPPSAPTNGRAEAGDRKVTVSWDAPEMDGGRSVVGYSIFRGTSPYNLEFLLNVATQQTYVDMDLKLRNGVDYFYSIAAVNEAGTGPQTDPIIVNPAGRPGAPNALAGRPESGMIVLSWSPPTDDGGRPIIGYVVLRGPSREQMAPYRTVGTTLEFVDLDVQVGDSYFYSVKAVNTVGEGEKSQAKLIEAPVKLSGRWMENPSAFWAVMVLVMVVMIAVVFVFLLRKKALPALRGAGKGEKAPNEARRSRDGEARNAGGGGR